MTEIDNFIGMKEESGDPDLVYKIRVHLGDRLALIIAGGGMRTFMRCMHFGVNAYLAGIGNLKRIWKPGKALARYVRGFKNHSG